MIKFLSSWAKGLGLSIVIVSIIEMVLPNNKTKKYIRMIMGIYILFTIVSPFIKNKEIFNLNEIDIEEYATTSTSVDVVVDQTSMNERIEDLYIEELEKDIVKKIEEKGFEVTKCKVKANIIDNDDESKITKIELKIEKNTKQNNEQNTDNIENKVVTEIQKIKPIDTSINSENNKSEEKENNKKNITVDSKVTKADIQNIKKFLIEEYEVNEKCLAIN